MMRKEIEFITELLLKTENAEQNENGNFEIEFKELKTVFTTVELIELSLKEFKVMSYSNSNTTEYSTSKIIKLKNNSKIEFNKFILTTYLKSIE